MVKHEIKIIADYSQETSLTLDELCDICSISSDVIRDLIAYDIIHPQTENQNQWVFNLVEFQRVKTVLRLQHDLDVNFAGAALALDLLDEIEELRAHAALLERHVLRGKL